MATYDENAAARLKHLAALAQKTSTAINGKVDKVTGKQLSTEDYTTAEKTKLTGIEAGAQVNVIESVTIDGTAQTVTGKAVALDLTNYAKKSDIATAINFKGTVASFGALPNDAKVGDMYNITAAGGQDENGVAIKAGDNVVKTSTGWDNVGGTIDLSGKVDKVTSAVQGNLVTFGTGGAIVDSGITFATDADVTAMLEEYFPTNG